MHVLATVALVLVLTAVPVAAAPSALSFAVEFAAGTLAAAVPFYAALFRTSEVYRPPEVFGPAEPANEDILLGLVAPPLLAGAAVTFVGRLFGVTSKLGGLAAILGASVAELFAFRAWELNLPEWLEIIAVPAITSVGAVVAFNREARSSP